MTEVIRRTGARFVCSIPGDARPNMAVMKGLDGEAVIVVVSPDTRPMIVSDGQATFLSPAEGLEK